MAPRPWGRGGRTVGTSLEFAMPERSNEVTRLEGFSDAVFAIALALLVVSLEVPKTMHALLNLVRGFLPFAAMFAMVCWIWYEHNVFFRRYGLQDAWTVALNCALLFVVLFYVYPLKFLTVGGLGPLAGMEDTPRITDGRTIMVLYSGGVVLIFGTFCLLYWHAWRLRRDLALTPVAEVTLRYSARAHLLTMLVGLASIALATLIRSNGGPAIAGFVYFSLGPIHTWNGMMAGRARRQLDLGAAVRP
jgi:uncharacterized membrane protein